MKIIPTWPRASVSRFHPMALQNRTGQCDPEKLFGETLVDSLLAM